MTFSWVCNCSQPTVVPKRVQTYEQQYNTQQNYWVILFTFFLKQFLNFLKYSGIAVILSEKKFQNSTDINDKHIQILLFPNYAFSENLYLKRLFKLNSYGIIHLLKFI